MLCEARWRLRQPTARLSTSKSNIMTMPMVKAILSVLFQKSHGRLKVQHRIETFARWRMPSNNMVVKLAKCSCPLKRGFACAMTLSSKNTSAGFTAKVARWAVKKTAMLNVLLALSSTDSRWMLSSIREFIRTKTEMKFRSSLLTLLRFFRLTVVVHSLQG